MSAQHTPGPWAQHPAYPWIIKQDCSPIAGPEDGVTICNTTGHPDSGFFPTPNTSRANACLIAAAPDMLAELKAARIALKEAELLLHKVYTEHGIAEIDDGDGTWVSVARAADRMDAAIDASNAVIEKATGAPA